MSSQARYVGAGVQPLIDAVKAAGTDPGDLRTIVWEATWARGYDDVVAPAPAIRLKEEGLVIHARPLAEGRFAGIIDTTHALWALVARGATPPAGARVRIVPAFIDGEIGWDVATIEKLGLGLSVRFARSGTETPGWVNAIRDVLGRIADAEAERRRLIVERRRAMMAIEPMKTFAAELETLQEQLKARVETESAATPEERAAYEHGNERQRKAIVDEVKARRLNRYNAEVAALRARIPELQAAYAKRVATTSDIRAQVTELEDAASRSRAISERIGTIEHRLDEIEKAGLQISADLIRLGTLSSADFAEIDSTVELLHDLIPRRKR